jgi:excisionase family DNA binding protein
MSENMIQNYFTIEEVAEQLGYSHAHVRRLIRQKQLAAVKLGRWRVSQEAIEDFIKRRSVIVEDETDASDHNI